MYQTRYYRNLHQSNDLVSFEVNIKETDLYISACAKLPQEATKVVRVQRRKLESYIENNPEFLTSLRPLSLQDNMPYIARKMTEVSILAGVGPMAAVAGVLAEIVGWELLRVSPEIIVENGGDVFIKTGKRRVIGIYPGEHSPFKNKLAVEIQAREQPVGISTSSGTLGHSLSLGKADSVTVLAVDAGLADAAATAIANMVITPGDLNQAIEHAQSIAGLTGVIVVKDDKLGIWGKVKLVEGKG